MPLTCDAVCKKCGEPCGAEVKNKRANAVKQLTDAIDFANGIIETLPKNTSTAVRMRLIIKRCDLAQTLAKLQGTKNKKAVALIEKKLKEVKEIDPAHVEQHQADTTPLAPEAVRFFEEIEKK